MMVKPVCVNFARDDAAKGERRKGLSSALAAEEL